MKIKQLEVGHMANLCYILIEDNKALIIDPGWEAEKILKEVKGLTINGIILTHNHPDHTGALSELKKQTGAEIIAHELNPYAEKKVKDRDIIKLGETEIKIIHTPGHTADSICLLAENNLFTGDTLFVQGHGRTDIGGNKHEMKRSLSRLMNLPQETTIYPGHNYDEKLITLKELTARAFQP